MIEVQRFKKALRGLDTLINIAIFVSAVLAVGGAFVLIRSNNGEGVLETLGGALVGILLAVFVKTLSLGMAYTLIAIAENTDNASGGSELM